MQGRDEIILQFIVRSSRTLMNWDKPTIKAFMTLLHGVTKIIRKVNNFLKKTCLQSFCLCLLVFSITFYLAVGLTALSFVLERKEGLLDRCWVAGNGTGILGWTMLLAVQVTQ